MDFYDILEKLCAERGIKPQNKDFMNAIQAKSGTISDWKKTRAYPTVKYLVAISDFFDTTIDYLTGRTDIAHPVKADEREAVILDAFRKSDEIGRATITQIALNERDRSIEERKKSENGASSEDVG